MSTPRELNHILNGMVDSIAMNLLPNGKREGRYWRVGSVHGEPGQSLKVCLDGSSVGLWKDFSSDDCGGDMLSLWQQSKGLTFVETLKEVREYLGVQEQPRLYNPGKKKKQAAVSKPKCTKPTGEVLKWFENRGIFTKSLEAYEVGQKDNTIVFPYLSPEGKLELIKYRDLTSEAKAGKKKIWSNQDPEYHLWGFHAIDDNTREVVICEGELDALTWHQQGIPAFSVPQGAGDGRKQEVWIENDFDRLQRFESLWISMDMDAAGQAAIHPIVSRLGAERCKIVDLGQYNDANEVHQDGELLKPFLDRAKTLDPEELRLLSDHHDDIIAEFTESEYSGNRLCTCLCCLKVIFTKLLGDSEQVVITL